MRKYLLNITAFLLAAIMVLNFQGCSLVGYGIGAYSDNKKATDDQVMPVEGITPGTLVKVVDKGGIIYEGKFEKIEEVEIQGDTLKTIWIKKGNYKNKIFIGNIDRVIVLGKQRKGRNTGATIGGVIDAGVVGFSIWVLAELVRFGRSLNPP